MEGTKDARRGEGFDAAAALLPPALRQAALSAKEAMSQEAEEFRLRCGRRPAVLLSNGEWTLPGAVPVTPQDLRAVLELATGASAHAYADSLRQGFICAKGGVRIGVCGQAVMGEVGIRSIKHLGSVSLRIPREVHGCASGLVGEAAQFPSTLLISPPGGGKTTLLRDMVRLLSDGGLRVALADERNEVAAQWEGKAQFDVGERTDVLSGAPKAEAALLLLRAMNPQVIALDEITAPDDARACALAANCGVRLLATAHGEGVPDLRKRKLYRELLELGIFRRAVVIWGRGAERTYEQLWL